METTLDYWNPANVTKVGNNGFVYVDLTPIVTSTKKIQYSDNIDLFEKFYKLNNKLRYCNGSRYTFQDKNLEAEYHDWIKSDDYKKKFFDLYYGNGVVD